MIIIPAIDLMDKKVVRLRQGEAGNRKTYSDDPLGIAQKWKEQGASWLHIVDLDAALELGNNLDVIEEIAEKSNLNTQVGGGIRSLDYAENLIKGGVKRVVVGTRAFQDEDFLAKLIGKFNPSSVALSIDIKEGKVALRGWRETLSLDIQELCRTTAAAGLEWLVYTDISRDGTLEGLNYEAIRELRQKTSLNIIASGGVGSMEDIRKVNSFGIWGVIVGKALYEGKFSLAEAIGSLQ